MGDPNDAGGEGEQAPATTFVGRTQARLGVATARARRAGERHVSIGVPFRAAERNRRVAASVLAGGVAYRLFLWLLPLCLILGGALGLGDAASTEDALTERGLPAGLVSFVGDVARSSDANWWWFLGIGVPLLLWEGYTGAKALQLIHALVWDDPPPRAEPLKASLAFTGVCSAFLVAVALSWALRDEPWFAGLAAAVLMIVPLAGLWVWASLHLPHGDASWRRLLPGALLVAVGFQVLHGAVLYFVVPKLEKATSHYGAVGVMTTYLFFMYIAGRLVVTAPILNSSLHEEILRKGPRAAAGPTGPP